MKLWILPVAYFALQAFKKASDAQTLNARFVNIDTKTKSAVIQVINPSTSEQNFQALVGDIIYNGAAVGVIDYRKATLIPKLGAINISLAIKVNIIGALEGIYNLVSQGKGQGVTLGFKGTFTTNDISIPWNETFPIVAKKK